jgi:hypothetical protein
MMTLLPTSLTNDDVPSSLWQMEYGDFVLHVMVITKEIIFIFLSVSKGRHFIITR